MSVEQGLSEMQEQRAGQSVGQDSGDFGGSDEYEGGDGETQHGMGQSKSSRRRRRKRKGKGEEGAGATAGAPATGGSMPDVLPGEVRSIQGNAVTAADGAGGFMPAAPPAGFRQQGGGGQGRSFAGSQGQNGQQSNGQNNNGQNSNAPGGTKRWKKKQFRDRPERGGRPGEIGQQAAGGGFAQQPSSGFGQQPGGFQGGGGGYQGGGGGFRGPDTHQPGNGGGFKRKGGGGGFGGKQRNGGGGGRGGFVGPMDHSYRPPNGNIFEAAPAFDAYQGQGRGGGRNSYQSDSQPIDYSQGRVIPIKEGTPTKIFFFIEDLFFTAKISETARKLGVKIEFIKNEKEQIAALTSAEDENKPGLIVFDLNNANAKPLTLIPKLKTKLKKSTSIIGFLSHLQGDLKAKAVEAGCDTVMPRAAFSQNLPNLLRRYGLEEAEEPNYNQ